MYMIKKHEISEMGISINGRMAISQFLKRKITMITRHERSKFPSLLPVIYAFRVVSIERCYSSSMSVFRVRLIISDTLIEFVGNNVVSAWLEQLQRPTTFTRCTSRVVSSFSGQSSL